jgi:hypothetical protein
MPTLDQTSSHPTPPQVVPLKSGAMGWCVPDPDPGQLPGCLSLAQSQATHVYTSLQVKPSSKTPFLPLSQSQPWLCVTYCQPIVTLLGGVQGTKAPG